MLKEIEENDHDDLLRHMCRDMTDDQLLECLREYLSGGHGPQAEIVKEELSKRQTK